MFARISISVVRFYHTFKYYSLLWRIGNCSLEIFVQEVLQKIKYHVGSLSEVLRSARARMGHDHLMTHCIGFDVAAELDRLPDRRLVRYVLGRLSSHKPIISINTDGSRVWGTWDMMKGESSFPPVPKFPPQWHPPQW